VTLKKKYLEVLGKKMAYVEEGEGDPIVFLHGNPTSSYLWRNVMPHLVNRGRCIAPDLIGMGDSEKLDESGPDRYTFAEHRTYLDELLFKLNVEVNVILVIHDWGSALGFDWANRHREAMQGIAFMESIVRPLAWSEFPKDAAPIFEGLRSPAGEDMILKENLFIEAVLPGSILGELSDSDMQVYRAPFMNEGEDRRPTLTWPRQIPLDGQPNDVVKLVAEYADWLKQSDLPKLFVNAEPGALLVGAQREFARSWPNLTEVTVAGSHFIQEDSPDDIGEAINEFVAGLRI
jgi:haloalkane dehalogenase